MDGKHRFAKLPRDGHHFETMSLLLHEFHQGRGARFTEVNGAEVVADYGDSAAEHRALTETAGVLDLSFRGRLCVVGTDRTRFLHGQVTNDVKSLRAGAGCYAALVTAKGKMVSDLNIFALADELLLDFEAGLSPTVVDRLEKYIVADDVQVVEVAPHYGLLSVQGPRAAALECFAKLPAQPHGSVKVSDPSLGELYLVNNPRLGSEGFDLFVPVKVLAMVADLLMTTGQGFGIRPCGWTALETARIEAGIPRFGGDMDESNLPLECGIEARAVSYRKGCYIGQEVINRIHSIGHVNRELVPLRLAADLPALPARGDKLFCADKEVGHVTSAVRSPRFKANIALGYLRREASGHAAPLSLRTAAGESPVRVATLPGYV